MSAQPEPVATYASSPVLFLSGAGLPAWVWDDVRADLPPGIATAVVRYPRAAKASLADYVDDAIAQAPWKNFAVDAHSIGGVVAMELLSRHPGRVTGILGVTAVIPRSGCSFVRSMPFPASLVLGVALRLAGTRPPAKAIRASLASGLSDVTRSRIVADFDPESIRLYLDRTSARDLPPARAYLRTAEDKELTAAVQRDAADVLEALWTEDLSTGHLPMLQDPTTVSQAVQKLVAMINA